MNSMKTQYEDLFANFDFNIITINSKNKCTH